MKKAFSALATISLISFTLLSSACSSSKKHEDERVVTTTTTATAPAPAPAPMAPVEPVDLGANSSGLAL